MTAGGAAVEPTERAERLEHYLPTEVQRLALRAALGPADTAQQDVSHWEQAVELDAELDAGTFRLLPLIAERIKDLSLECGHADRISGAAKAAWVRNLRLFAGTRPGVETLVDAGLTVTLLKGAALTAMPGSRASRNRSMADIDVLVDPDAGPEAFRLLREQGWQPKYGPVTSSRWHHSVGLKLPGSAGEIDLHWRELCYPPSSQWDAWLRSGTTATSFMDLPVRVPAPDRLLVHAVAHGARPNFQSPIRWVADAHQLIVNHPTAIDWSAITAIATDIHMSARFAVCLGWLRRHLDSPVPSDVLDALATRKSVIERIEVANEQNYRRWTLVGRCVNAACMRLQSRPDPAWSRAAGTRPHFLRDFLGVTRAHQVPRAAWHHFGGTGLWPFF